MTNEADSTALTAEWCALPSKPNSADSEFRYPEQSLNQVGENSEVGAFERDLNIWIEEKALATQARELRTRLEKDGTVSQLELEAALKEETAANEELELARKEALKGLIQWDLLDMYPEMVRYLSRSDSFTDPAGKSSCLEG